MWNENNTEGFSQDELDMINRVIERVVQVAESDLEQEWIDAAITSEWREGLSEAELFEAVAKRFGLVS